MYARQTDLAVRFWEQRINPTIRLIKSVPKRLTKEMAIVIAKPSAKTCQSANKIDHLAILNIKLTPSVNSCCFSKVKQQPDKLSTFLAQKSAEKSAEK